MSDFTSFITEPFRPWGAHQKAAEWFRHSACWVEIVAENGNVAFADILSDDDEVTAWDHAKWVIEQIAELLPEDADLHMTGLDYGTDEYEPVVLSVSGHRSDIKWQAKIDARRIKAFLRKALGDAYNAQGIDEYLWS